MFIQSDTAILTLFLAFVPALAVSMLLGLAKRVKAKILQAATSEVYGDQAIHPQPEHYGGHLNLTLLKLAETVRELADRLKLPAGAGALALG